MSITAAISNFICKDMRPYRVVENAGFPSGRRLQAIQPDRAPQCGLCDRAFMNSVTGGLRWMVGGAELPMEEELWVLGEELLVVGEELVAVGESSPSPKRPMT
ncbi:unnamed protein product [Gadus morhua 'NCC']